MRHHHFSDPPIFRCGHIRDPFNTKPSGTCRTCDRAYKRARYHRLRAEGLTPNEIFGYRPLTEANLAGMLKRMGGGLNLGQATAGPSGYRHSTIYRKLRIWAPSNRDRAILIKRLSQLNVATQHRQRWQARRSEFEPDSFPRIDPQQLDYEQIEHAVRVVRATSVGGGFGADLRNEIRQTLIMDLLEGRCCYENLRLRAAYLVRQHFQEKCGLSSVDQSTFRDGSRSLADLAAYKAWLNE